MDESKRETEQNPSEIGLTPEKVAEFNTKLTGSIEDARGELEAIAKRSEKGDFNKKDGDRDIFDESVGIAWKVEKLGSDFFTTDEEKGANSPRELESIATRRHFQFERSATDKTCRLAEAAFPEAAKDVERFGGSVRMLYGSNEYNKALDLLMDHSEKAAEYGFSLTDTERLTMRMEGFKRECWAKEEKIIKERENTLRIERWTKDKAAKYEAARKKAS